MTQVKMLLISIIVLPGINAKCHHDKVNKIPKQKNNENSYCLFHSWTQENGYVNVNPAGSG